MSYNITPVIQAVIALCAALVTAVVIPWIRQKIGAQDTEDLIAWVRIAVAAAEQLYTSAQGAEKKQYVLEFLRDKGMVVDETEVNSTVEAAVLELHNTLYGTGKVGV